ncbi:hypothetical protein SASPL_126464 [Salvia splendens]|uniref:NB-ARC domain-containing protein n=1 Tax=Salvia splendens TaxID=180675 RepID=A0A8X8XKJ2_SALSN|nr:hypothetical protein SASPL_126464 [Salvia splendens]
MAYAAATSLKQTIQGLLCSSNISLDSSSREILDIAHNHLTSLQETLKKSDERLRSNGLRELEKEIRDAIHNLEDSLESQFLSGLEEEEEEEEEEEATICFPLELDLKEVSHEFNSFAEAAKKMKEDYNNHLDNPSSDIDHDASAAPSQIACNVKMVGLSEQRSDLKDHLMGVIRPDDFGFFSFFGKPGTGRSLVAWRVYDDIQGSFECSAWVRIGSTYDLTQLLLNIISQINPDVDHEFISSQGDEIFGKYVYNSLEGRRYMVALDDVRDTDVLIKLRRSLPEQNNGSVVLLTTELSEVAEFDESFVLLKPPLIDEDIIWPNILTIFFEGGIAPPGFEEIGRKIARNCGDCRLVVGRIILILRKMKKEEEIWSGLAEAQHDRVYMMDDELSEITSHGPRPDGLCDDNCRPCISPPVGTHQNNRNTRHMSHQHMWNPLTVDGDGELWDSEDSLLDAELCDSENSILEAVAKKLMDRGLPSENWGSREGRDGRLEDQQVPSFDEIDPPCSPDMSKETEEDALLDDVEEVDSIEEVKKAVVARMMSQDANEVQKYLQEDDQVWSNGIFRDDISMLVEKTQDALFPDRDLIWNIARLVIFIQFFGIYHAGKPSRIEVVECHPLTGDWARKMKDKNWRMEGMKMKGRKSCEELELEARVELSTTWNI